MLQHDQVVNTSCFAQALTVNKTVHTLYLDRNNAGDEFGLSIPIPEHIIEPQTDDISPSKKSQKPGPLTGRMHLM